MKRKNDLFGLLSTLVVFAFFLLAPLYTGVAEESAAAQTARNFLSQVMNVTATLIVESPYVSYDIIGLPYKTLTADTCCDVWVSEDGSAVYGYGKKSMFADEDTAGKTHADAISEAAAFAAMTPLLQYLDLSTTQSDYDIVFEDMGGETENDLWGCVWIVHREMELNGIPCRTRVFTGLVSAASGAIFTFRNRPVIPPENTLNGDVTYAVARQATQSWLSAWPYFSAASPTLAGDENEGVKVIAPQENHFAPADDEQTAPTKTYYSWEVPFEWTEWGDEQFEGVVWVNVETGEVVGAGAE